MSSFFHFLHGCPLPMLSVLFLLPLFLSKFSNLILKSLLYFSSLLSLIYHINSNDLTDPILLNNIDEYYD